MPYTSWPQVFKLAVKVAKELRKKNPKLTQAQATKQAFKSPEYLKAKKEYDEHKKKKGGTTGGKARRRTVKRKAPKKKRATKRK